MLGAGRYTIREGGVIHHFSHWGDLPDKFDDLIAWCPDIPPPPHTDEQHAEIAGLTDRFKQDWSKQRWVR